MKPLLVTLGMLGLLIATTQLLRHLCVVWMPPTASLIDPFDDRTDKDVFASLGISELTKQYDEVRRKIKVVEAGKPADERGKINIWEEPYKTEDKLRSAIQTWEVRNREMVELHFFWWCGLMITAAGGAIFLQGSRWLAVAALATGFVEMLYGASPSVRFLGGTMEFERLLMWKLIYTAATLALLIGLWFGLERMTRQGAPDKV